MSRWYSKQFKTRTTRAMRKWGKLMHEDTTSKRMASGVKLVKRPLCGWVLRVNWAKATASAANGPSVPMYDPNFDMAMVYGGGGCYFDRKALISSLNTSAKAALSAFLASNSALCCAASWANCSALNLASCLT